MLLQVVTDTMAHLPQSVENPLGLIESMNSMRRQLDRQHHVIIELKHDLHIARSTEEQLKDSITLLTEENIKAKKETTDLNEKFSTNVEILESNIKELALSLKDEKEKSQRLETKQESTEKWYKESLMSLQQDIDATANSFKKCKAELELAIKERDEAKRELTAVENKTRKLLSSLDLNNNVSKTSDALDHARNIAYARRRTNTLNSSIQCVTACSDNQPALSSQDRRGSITMSIDFSPCNTPMTASSSSHSVNSIPLPLKKQRSGSITEVKKLDLAPIKGKLPNSGILKNDFVINTNENIQSKTSMIEEVQENFNENQGNYSDTLQCTVCGKAFQCVSNFEGACLRHADDAQLLNQGTEYEIWSCCKSTDSMKGCIKSRHTPK